MKGRDWIHVTDEDECSILAHFATRGSYWDRINDVTGLSSGFAWRSVLLWAAEQNAIALSFDPETDTIQATIVTLDPPEIFTTTVRVRVEP